MMQTGTLKKWLIVIAVVYLVFPRDLIPDFVGLGPGFIDDLLLIALLAYFYRKHLRRALASETRESGRAGEESEEIARSVRKRRRPEPRSIPARFWASLLRHPAKRFELPTRLA